MKNTNMTETQLEAYLRTDKAKDKEVLLDVFRSDYTAQYNDVELQNILYKKYGQEMSLRTITARLNDLQHLQEIKISKIENGKQHYSKRLPFDPYNRFSLSWKEKFALIEKIILDTKNEYLISKIENIKNK